LIRHALPRVRSGSIISRAPAASGALLIWLSNWCANGAQMLNQARQCAQATAIGLMRPRAPQVSRVKPTLFGTECWVPTPVSPWTSPREEAEKCWRTDFLINPRVGARIEMTARDRLRCYFHPVSGAARCPTGTRPLPCRTAWIRVRGDPRRRVQHHIFGPARRPDLRHRSLLRSGAEDPTPTRSRLSTPKSPCAGER